MKYLTNRVFGKLTVISLDHVKSYKSARNTQTKAYWLCRCECGVEKAMRGEHLTAGKVSSCGCVVREKAAQRFTTHGLSGSPEHRAWLYMRARVLNPDKHRLKYYGDIDIAEDWDVFENFLRDMGSKPTPSHELDRISPFLPYCKENCRWATRSEQMQNTRRHYIEVLA